MSFPEGKGLEIHTVSQNRINDVKKIMKFDENSKKTLLGVTSRGLHPETKF